MRVAERVKKADKIEFLLKLELTLIKIRKRETSAIGFLFALRKNGQVRMLSVGALADNLLSKTNREKMLIIIGKNLGAAHVRKGPINGHFDNFVFFLFDPAHLDR